MNNDTICAMATPAGGAIAVIRVSGIRTLEIADKVFVGIGGKRLSDALPNTVHFGNIIDHTGEVIDEVLASVFHAPHSYTGEDSVEFSCHGSSYIISKILQVLMASGCRQANPGEYTMRAYLNGKMDLSQAEAVADLIASTNRATHHIAMSQLKGHFSNDLSALRDKLLKLTSLLELELDFSDHEELEFADRSELQAIAADISNRIEALCHSFEAGKAIKEGVAVAIVGKTNVGKSTLLNQLLGEDKAIVSNIHGTTRDVIEDTTTIHGITFRFIDTAGIRATDDEIEQLGIQRTYDKLNSASIVLWLTDQDSMTPSDRSEIAAHCTNQKVIVVRNKTDLSPTPLIAPMDISNAFATIGISAKNGTRISELREAIYQAANIPEIHENDVIVTSARHYQSLCQAQASLARVTDALAAGLSADLISEDLRQVLFYLAEITGGAITPTEVLSNIFAHFCVGK